MARLPWRPIVRFAAFGTLLIVVVALLDAQAKGGHVSLVNPGLDGPSVEVIQHDFPDLGLPEGLGHDGQQFYAIAREPMHLDQVAEHLDRPHYRLQRPLLAWLGWALAPTGGGDALVFSLFLVGALAVFGLGVAGGALSAHLGGPSWPALLLPLLPGSYTALRITVADTLALALALGAVVLAERGRTIPAAVAGALASLGKESVLVILIGHALLRRTRASVTSAVTATATTGLWFVALRVLVDAHGPQVFEFTWPFGGVVTSLDEWVSGEDWIAGVTVLAGFVLAGIAMWRRGPHHRLFGALVAVTAFTAFLGRDVVGLDYNGTRTTMPVLVLAVLVLVTPGAVGPSPSAGLTRPRAAPASGP